MQWTNTKDWVNVDLDRETEHQAALVTRDFLLQVKSALQSVKPEQARSFLSVPFSQFEKSHLKFLLAAIGTGEVRAVAGDSRAEETGIHGLWRVQQGGIDRFEVTRVPSFVLQTLSTGDFPDALPELPRGAFAAPAILQELRKAQAELDPSALRSVPPYTIELTRQPLTPEDLDYLQAVLGIGNLQIGIAGFADASIESTAVRGIWRSKIFNKAGKALFDAYVVVTLPEEVPNDEDELHDGVKQCDDILAWIEADLNEGRL